MSSIASMTYKRTRNYDGSTFSESVELGVYGDMMLLPEATKEYFKNQIDELKGLVNEVMEPKPKETPRPVETPKPVEHTQEPVEKSTVPPTTQAIPPRRVDNSGPASDRQVAYLETFRKMDERLSSRLDVLLRRRAEATNDAQMTYAEADLMIQDLKAFQKSHNIKSHKSEPKGEGTQTEISGGPSE